MPAQHSPNGNESHPTGDDALPSPGRASYAPFARRYAEYAQHKPHNALYERPATQALLGDVAGLRVLDAGCGPGIRSEQMARAGASVHAFDVTPEMVELARTRCAGLAVEVAEGDLGAPLHWLADASFDRILCSLALDYVERLAPVFAEFARIARPGAALVFSLAHPMRDWIDTRTHRSQTYFDTARFGMHWSGFGEPKPYVEAYRRPLSDILNGLADGGWLLERVVEPLPQPQMKAVSPALFAELSQSPAFLCARAVRRG